MARSAKSIPSSCGRNSWETNTYRSSLWRGGFTWIGLFSSVVIFEMIMEILCARTRSSHPRSIDNLQPKQRIIWQIFTQGSFFNFFTAIACSHRSCPSETCRPSWCLRSIPRTSHRRAPFDLHNSFSHSLIEDRRK